MPSADTKFFIWARGRWRELCLSSGRIQGVGAAPVRFLYVKGKKLVAARGSKVLRALRSLAENKPSNVHDGPPLPQSRHAKVRARHSRSRHRHRHCCCAAHGNRCNISLKEVAQNVHIQAAMTPASRSDAGVQASEPDKNYIETNNNSPVKPISSPVKETQTGTVEVAPLPRAKRKRSPVPEKASKKRDSVTCSLKDRLLERHLCKELLINEGDVDLYRTYLLKHDPDFDVYQFDTDDSFKMKLFYRINPVVSLTYCKRMEKMLRERRVSQDTISLKDFATKLGLRSITDQESSSKRYKMRRRTAAQTSIASSVSDDGTDKENAGENRRKNEISTNSPHASRTVKKMMMVEAVRRNINSVVKRGASDNVSAVSERKEKSDKCDTIELSSSSGSSKEFAAKKPKFFTKKPVRKPHVAKPSSQSSKVSGVSSRYGGGREYSNLEDHAIVSFVSGGERARLVNGNRVWRELQDQYTRLTGQVRSWHSLRNRYLRYILPSLGQLALPAAHAARLRAAAAKGEIKSRKLSSEPNPLCVVPRVRSAWAARRPSPSPSPTPNLSSSSSSSSSPARKRSPSPEKEERVLRARKKENTNTSIIEDSPPPPPRRSLRSSALPPPPKAPPPLPFSSQPPLPRAHVRPRMRKLYNPNNPTQ